MKKKIIALSIAFVLVVGAAIGTTLAYLNDTAGSVLNEFTIGDLDISAYENVNHLNSAGADKDTTPAERIDLVNNGASHEYENVIPGDKLVKDVVITNTANSNPAIFAIKVVETLPSDDALTGNAWKDSTTPALPTDIPTIATYLGVEKAGNGVYYFYYYMPKDTNTSAAPLDLGVTIPTSVGDAATIAAYNAATIDVSVAAIQADNIDIATAQDELKGLLD